MSLRVNTNIPAMTALRNLGNTNADFGNSITRLSSGLRINTAADDPAGLIISEGMRAQIRGLDQAIRNSQDAVNMAKTAEGALDEVQRLLREVRGLAVHSANTAVVDSAQLQANQQQIRSTIQSINRIASQTQFANRKLLDGSAGTRANITDTANIANLYLGGTVAGDPVRTGTITVTRTTAATQTRTDTNVNYAALTTAPAAAGSFTINGYTFSVSPATDTLTSIIAKINEQSANTGVAATVMGTGPYQVRLTSTEYGAQFPINFFDPSGILNSTPSPAPTVAGADAVVSMVVPVSPSGTQTVLFTGGRGPRTSGLRLTDTDGNVITLTPAGNGASGLGTGAAIGTITGGNVQFQIGANAGQQVAFAMPNAQANQLGTDAISGLTLADVDVTTATGANNAIKIIDSAISQLASMRGNLGSFQKNFLESTVRSLDVAKENLVATESSIRDANMAEEMTKYTRLQILSQSGMSVLAQANQQPQNLLQLLRG